MVPGVSLGELVLNIILADSLGGNGLVRCFNSNLSAVIFKRKVKTHNKENILFTPFPNRHFFLLLQGLAEVMSFL